MRKIGKDLQNKKIYVYVKTKRSYYSNLNEKNVIDNRKFWKTEKPMLSNKYVNNGKFTLVDNEKIIANSKEIAKF